MPALLQPRPFAPRSAWHPCTTPNPAQLKQAPSYSPHTDMPTWCGAGRGQARRKQSRPALLGAVISPRSPTKRWCSPATPQAARAWDMLLCPHASLTLVWASCPNKVAECGAGHQLQTPLCR